jgi:hypothetical protein
MGLGSMILVSTKQKVNSRSSTEAELISIDDILSKIIWLKNFMEHKIGEHFNRVVYQDNLSSMKLKMNGKESSGKRKRHFDIKYFYMCVFPIRNTNILKGKHFIIFIFESQ